MRNDTCGLQAGTFTLCALPVPAETQRRALERQAASEERIAEAVQSSMPMSRTLRAVDDRVERAEERIGSHGEGVSVLLVVNVLIVAAVVWRWWRGK